MAQDTWLERFPGVLVDARKEAGLSREALAERVGVSRQAADAWEKGISLPTLPVFFNLAAIFDWPVPTV